MINGRITPDLQVLITVAIRDARGDWIPVDVAIDTGFNGQLALPDEYVDQLGLTLNRIRRVTPAIGQTRSVPSGYTSLLWDGAPRAVRVIRAATKPLLGMAFLLNHRITIDATTNGPVTITPLGG